jgi:RND family efflux transporter MFP subunit
MFRTLLATLFVLCGPLVFSDTVTYGDELDCLIEPQEVVHLSSPVEGILEKVYVERGAIVRKGQIVAQLDSNLENANVSLARARATVEAAIKSGEARLTYSSLKLARAERLYERDLIALADLQEAQTEKQLAEMALVNAFDNQRIANLELERANVALSRNVIRSPITGVVVERFLSPGEFVSGQFKNDSPIVKIAQIDPLRVEVFVPVAMRGKINAATPAKVTLEAPASTSYDVRVAVVDRVVDPASGTFRVRLNLPNPTHRILAGLKCKIRFLSAEKSAAQDVLRQKN